MGRFVEHSAVAGTGWKIWQDDEGKYNNDNVTHAILMDLRNELRRLRAIFECPNATQIPRVLRTIAQNTKKRPRAR